MASPLRRLSEYSCRRFSAQAGVAEISTLVALLYGFTKNDFTYSVTAPLLSARFATAEQRASTAGFHRMSTNVPWLRAAIDLAAHCASVVGTQQLTNWTDLSPWKWGYLVLAPWPLISARRAWAARRLPPKARTKSPLVKTATTFVLCDHFAARQRNTPDGGHHAPCPLTHPGPCGTLWFAAARTGVGC